MEGYVRSFLIGLVAAFAAWLPAWASGQDFGAFGPLVVAVVGVIVNALQKLVPPVTDAKKLEAAKLK